MKARLYFLFIAFCTAVLSYAQESYAYVLATEADVNAGGNFILASSSNLDEAFVASKYNVSKNYIETIKGTKNCGVFKIGLKNSENYCKIEIGGVCIGAVEDNNKASNLSNDGTNTWWSILPCDVVGKFRIVNKLYINKKVEEPRRLQFYLNSPDTRVANYNATPGSKFYYEGDVYLFKQVPATTVSVSASRYATFYNESAFQMPEGLMGGIVTGSESATDAEAGADYTLTYDWRYEPGSIVPAKTALVLYGESGSYSCVDAESSEPAPAENLLHGTVDASGLTHCEAGGPYCYYKLAYGGADNRTLGFWWGADGGAAFVNAAGKAYLAIPQAMASRVRGFSLPETVSGMSCISLGNARQKLVYDLYGRLVWRQAAGQSAVPLPPGFYIVDGKKIWVK